MNHRAKGNTMSDITRPTPLREVASKVGVAWATASGFVGLLVTFGVLSAAKGEAINTAGAALSEAFALIVGGLMPLIAGVVSAFRTVRAGEDHVTPVGSPVGRDGVPLVPAGSVVRGIGDAP